MNKEWLSLKTLSQEHADIGERKLREFLGHPTRPLPARLVGGKWLVNRQDFDEWVRSFPRAGEATDQIVDGLLKEITNGPKH
jgi:hypothetical protein